MFTISCEVQYNTRVVVVTAIIDRSDVEVRLRLDRDRQVALLEFFSSSEPSHVLQSYTTWLPSAVLWNEPVRCSKGKDHLSLRLGMAPFGPHESVLLQPSHLSSSTTTTTTSSSSTLSSLPSSPIMLFCRRCLGPLLSRPLLKSSRLPSLHWQNLAELWGCHTDTFAQAPKSAPPLAADTLHVADSHGEVRVDLTQAQALRKRPEPPAGAAGCSKCNHLLGFWTRQGEGVAFYWDTVVAKGIEGIVQKEEEDSLLFRWIWNDWDCAKRLSRQLVEAAQAKGTMRFHCPGGYGVTLLNWNTMMSVEERKQATPVARVRYEMLKEDSAAFGVEDEMGVIGRPDWDRDDSLKLLEALENNRKRYIPESLGSIPGSNFKFSFLWL